MAPRVVVRLYFPLTPGGLDVNVSHRISVRLFQAEYFLTRFRNGKNNRQNNFRLTVGLVSRFGSR